MKHRRAKTTTQESWFLVTYFNLNCLSPGLFGCYIHSSITPSILFYQFVLFRCRFSSGTWKKKGSTQQSQPKNIYGIFFLLKHKQH